jgi:elongator complex protein 1
MVCPPPLHRHHTFRSSLALNTHFIVSLRSKLLAPNDKTITYSSFIMENLVLLGEKRQSLNVPSSDPNYNLWKGAATIADLCPVHSDDPLETTSTCYVVLTNNGFVSKFDGRNILWTCDLGEESEIAEEWFQIHFCDPELVCLSRKGAIMTIDPSTGETELVGIFDQGLDDAAWSPDGETLAMVTSTDDDDGDENPATETLRINSRLMTMNAQFEVLAEVTIPRHKLSSSSSQDNDVSLAWRPDGMLLGVSSVDEDDGVRKIRIYKRETLELHAIGRAEDASGTLVKNLQSSKISWASTGCSQLLAAVQRKGKKTHQIVFFEPNGLRHREFLLREAPTTDTTYLKWNSTSDLLAVGLREEGASDKIQLWHRCNYHWYLKREFRYPNQRVEGVKFNYEDPYHLTVILNGVEWREYEVRWDPSTVITFQDKCNALVVDGSLLNITEFHKALIPPPMFAKQICCELPINELAKCYDSQYCGSVLIAMSNGGLMFFFNEKQSAFFQPVNIHWENLDGIDPLSLRSFVITKVEAHQLLFVATTCTHGNHPNETLVEVAVENLDGDKPKAFVKQVYPLDGRVFRMANWSDASGGCVIQLRDRSLFEYEIFDSGNQLVGSEAQPLMELCPWIVAVKNGSLYSSSTHEESNRSRLLFGLSSKARLYFHDIMLSDSASSFMVSLHHEFLCYISKGSRCHAHFLPLREINELDPLMGIDQNLVLEGYEPRSVELGAKVMAIFSHMPTMILQMPRGNLEGIYPRALMLRYVMTKIMDKSYGEAFRMMRKHKVDLNLIVDLDPVEFLESGISIFIKQVDNVDHLNLFISNLQNYDVKQTRFPVPAWFQRGNSSSQLNSSVFDFKIKVNEVCKKARAVMADMETTQLKPERYFLLPILSTFAKEDPPKLDEALLLIKNHALKQHSTTSLKNPLFSENAQHSIHYLAFLAEYELLFETSLGMYDFEIARAIARNSQMDPKIYLPLLKRHNALPMYYSRYEVDMRLQRYEFALRNLHQSLIERENLNDFSQEPRNGAVKGNSFDDCLSFINEHKLHRVGLELFHKDPEKTKLLLVGLGNSLMSESRPKTALSVFLSANPPDLEGAKQAAKASKDWRCFFSILEEEATEENGSLANGDIPREKRRQAALDLANEIASSSAFSEKSSKQTYSDAAKLLIDYGDDLIGAIDYLVQAESWSEGFRIAAYHSRQDLKKRCVDAAVAYARTSIGIFVDRSNEFEKANERYAEVLKLRKQNIQLEGPDTLLEEDETGSLFSSASTASNMSLRSNASISSASSRVSSVISVRTANTFQMTGGEENDRHRSKFHKGKKQKQRDRRKKKNRKKPGSEEELQEMVGLIKASCPNADYACSISENMRFLIFAQHLSLAKEVYMGYTKMCHVMDQLKSKRLAAASLEKEKAELLTLNGGEEHEMSHSLLRLPVEKEVDEIVCAPLEADVVDLFDYIQIAS